MEKEKKMHTYNGNFIEAVKNAFHGVKYTITTQSSIKKQLVVAILVIIFSLFLKLTKIEYLFLIFSIFLVFITETINTAIETAVNLVTEEYHPKAKITKDVGAGAVILASLNAVITGIILFGDKIILYLQELFS